MIPAAVKLGDLDNDGDLDVVVSCFEDDELRLIGNYGDGTLSTRQGILPIGREPRTLEIADIDGDQDLDITVTNTRDSLATGIVENQCYRFPCTADLNDDGDLNFFDVSAFVVAFTNGDPSADFLPDGQFTFFDVSIYLAEYQLGCP